MSEPIADSRPRGLRHRILLKLFITSLYLAIAVLLVGWELQDQGDLFSSNECNLRSSPRGESPFINPLYRRILPLVLPSFSGRVSVVDIQSSLEDIQQNVCPARAFTAYLIQAIAARGPAVIAIDKFYSQGACLDNDPDTALLSSAITMLQKQNIPVVVGESTQPARNDPSNTCLAEAPQLDLGTWVQRGLTRLNQDVLRLPLQWPVLAHDGDKQPSPAPAGYSFSLKTAMQVNKSLPQNLQDDHVLSRPQSDPAKPLENLQQPFVNVTGNLVPIPATSLLCPASPEISARWPKLCGDTSSEAASEQSDQKSPKTETPPIDLRNKVVVIGAESESDFPSVLGEGMYGFELQARYIDALLTPRGYIRQISPWILLIPLALYFILSELTIPYMHIHRHPRWPLFHIEWPIVWTIGLWFATMLLGFLLPLAFHRFPPLEVLLGISGILVSRLLIEGWALLNERSEGPGEEGLA